MRNNSGSLDRGKIKAKFGGDFIADERTFTMGIDLRFTSHFAGRFRGKTVLETCTGGGFTTLALARTARRVITVDIDSAVQEQARTNVARAGLLDRVEFVNADVMDSEVLERLPKIDAAFLDPDWAVTGPGHAYRFINSNTRPPADELLNRIASITPDIALVLPPLLSEDEFKDLPAHECECLFLNGNHELYCLYFGSLIWIRGNSEFRAGK